MPTTPPLSLGNSSFIRNAITLRTSGGRLAVFGVLSVLIFVAPYHWLTHLSLWQALGWRSAPSIGLTRAYWLFMHGHPAAAWRRNHLIYVVLLIGVPLLLLDCYRLLAPKLRHRML